MTVGRGIRTQILTGCLAALGAGLHPSAVSAQASRIEAIVSERRLEYQAAVDDYQSALAARAAAESRFSRLTQDIAEARAADDQDRRNQALSDAQRLTVSMLALDQRVEETAGAVRTTRASLLDALDAHLDLLAEQISFAPSARDSTELGAIYRDVRNQFAAVERDGRGAMALVPILMPEVTADARDGPLELRVKAELLDKRASQADSLITDLDAEVAELGRRAQRDRGLRELMTGLDRFGDITVPVGGARTATEGAEQELLTGEQLEERLEALRLLRARYESYRDEARRRARDFRRLAGDVS